MTAVRRWGVPLALVAACLVALVLTEPKVSEAGTEVLQGEQLRIMAPAEPGGGWDQTAREMQGALGDLVGRTEVYNVGGAGGTIGLSQFQRLSGEPAELMATGAIMQGAIETNDAAYSLEDTTLLARLTTDYEVVVVPARSSIRDMRGLADAMRRDVRRVSIAGGSAGGVEQILAGLIAEDVGAEPSQVNFVAHSGGGEALSTILSGRATAAISGITEILPQIESGQVRAVAVSSTKRRPELRDTPTLRESGVDVELSNWRGIVAPPGTPPEQEARLERLMGQMHDSAAWRETLERQGWDDAFMAGAPFERFVAAEQRRTRAVIDEIGIG